MSIRAKMIIPEKNGAFRMALTLVYFFRLDLNHFKNFNVAIDSEHILAKIVVIPIKILKCSYVLLCLNLTFLG